MDSAWEQIKETFSNWSDHNVPRLSAALAYYTLFSLAPLLVMVGRDGAKVIQGVLQSAHKPNAGIVAICRRSESLRQTYYRFQQGPWKPAMPWFLWR